MKLFAFVLIVITIIFHASFTISLSHQVETYNEEFNHFLKDALEKYPAWLRNNSLDPSPPTFLEDNLNINNPDYNFQLTCKITDEQIVGYTNQSNQFEVTEVSSIVNSILKLVQLELENRGVILYQGRYTANGTIGTDNPLKGNGSWIYKSNVGIKETISFQFNVTEDGYIDISDEDYYIHMVNPWRNTDQEIYFENLWDDGAGGYAEVVQSSLLGRFIGRISDSETRQPARQLLRQYWAEVFQETPLADIIGSKLFNAEIL